MDEHILIQFEALQNNSSYIQCCCEHPFSLFFILLTTKRDGVVRQWRVKYSLHCENSHKKPATLGKSPIQDSMFVLKTKENLK